MTRMSVATIDKPEFINIKPCNPLISECEIKVMYVGDNRNRSVITKDVAREMANTLPGCPIVGYFKKDKQDFGDHGERVVIDDEGLRFECLTRPYGFVAPDAKVWFQKFEELDEKTCRTVVREYLMTTGYLWTGQYPECQSAIDEGKPHSMELDNDTLIGEWTKNYKSGIDFFIINDAIFSKLCILGDDVEPCFEGSSVTAPEISASFTKVDEKFTSTLFTMMQELKDALKGEQKMFENDDKLEVQSSFASDKKKEEEEKEKAAPSEEEAKDEESKAPAQEEEDEDKKKKNFAKEDDEEDKEEKPASKDEEEDDEKKKDKFAKSDEEDKKDEENVDKDNKSSEDKKEEDEDEKKKYSLLEEEYNTLKTSYSELESRYNELLAFRNQIEDEKKDALINSFYMLSDEDKAEVIENKAKYSLDDIEAKLSVICVRKKVNFDLEDTSDVEDKEESPVTTFSLNEQASAVPAWVSALRNTKNGKNN